MPYVTKEQIAKAKQMNLLTYLQTFEPQELVHVQGDVYSTRTHDSLKISNGKWCWWSRHIGGRSALDYLIKVRGMVFTDAVKYLCKCTGYAPAPVYLKKPKPRSIFRLPKQNADNDRILSYLTGRGIDLEVLRYCIDTGRLYEDWRHNCVFVGFDKSGKPRYAMLRGTSSNSTFMVDVSGSNKRYSFSIQVKEENNTVILFESAIDLMSYGTLMKVKGQDWRRMNYLSLAGIYLPKKNIMESTVPLALAQYLKDNPGIHKIVLCLDNDRAGREAASAISAVLHEQYEVENRPPPQGKDYNDLLQIKLGLHSTRKQNDIIR